MKTYHVILGYDVPFYHTVKVEARDEAEAETIALGMDVDESLYEPCYDAADDTRIVDVIEATKVYAP